MSSGGPGWPVSSAPRRRPRSPRLVDAGDNGYAVWLTWLASAGADALRAAPDLTAGADVTPLLYRLVRHSALREYALAAVRIELTHGILGDWEHIDPELVDIRPGGQTATVWRQLQRTIPVAGTTTTVQAYLDGITAASATDPNTADLAAFRAALQALATAGEAALERHLRQTLDVSSHRLDAIISSVANRRLADLRTASPAGTLLGGYGWVENLAPRDVGAFASDGYIHAPSVAQSVTSAVLRSGYLAAAGGAANPFAIDLRSDRARVAMRLLDAVRSGQPTGPFLGAMFERALQQLGGGQYTSSFRQCAPPAAQGLTAGASATTAAPAPGTLDGLALAAQWAAQDAAVTAVLSAVQSDDAHRSPVLYPAVVAALSALGDAVDAASDGLLAESVHQAVRGSPTRAAATLDAAARGAGTVPELEFLKTPSAGTTLAHRVALASSAPAATATGTGPGWTAGTGSVRAKASPALEALLESWLPTPSLVKCTVTATPPGGQEPAVVLLSACALSALDLVYATDITPPTDRSTDIPDAVALAVHDAAGGGSITIDWARNASFAAGELTFGELTAICRELRRLLSEARPLSAPDLAALGTPVTTTIDTDLAARCSTAVEALQAAAAASDPHADGPWLRSAVALGVRGAATVLLQPTPDPQLIAGTAAELQRRTVALDALRAPGVRRRPVGATPAVLRRGFSRPAVVRTRRCWRRRQRGHRRGRCGVPRSGRAANLADPGSGSAPARRGAGPSAHQRLRRRGSRPGVHDAAAADRHRGALDRGGIRPGADRRPASAGDPRLRGAGRHHGHASRDCWWTSGPRLSRPSPARQASPITPRHHCPSRRRPSSSLFPLIRRRRCGAATRSSRSCARHSTSPKSESSTRTR